MIGKREQKKRIKDCLSQLKYLDSVYAAEIKKPEAEQDADLLEECLETMTYLHDVVESLSRQTQIQRSGVGSGIVLRRVAIVVIALAVLLIGMSVAEAAGFRVWSALIHWDSSYLHITYAPEDQEPLPSVGQHLGMESDTEESGFDNEIVCDSLSEAIDALGTHVLLPSYIPAGMEEAYVSYSESSANLTSKDLTVLWENEGNFIFYFVTIPGSSEWSTSFAYPQEDTSATKKVINEIEFIFVDNQVFWSNNIAVYRMETNLKDQELQSILSSLSN